MIEKKEKFELDSQKPSRSYHSTGHALHCQISHKQALKKQRKKEKDF